MNLSMLAAKQKRIQDWTRAAKQSAMREEVRSEFVQRLEQYRKYLADCWRSGELNPERVLQLQTLERELEKLHGEARLLAA